MSHGSHVVLIKEYKRLTTINKKPRNILTVLVNTNKKMPSIPPSEWSEQICKTEAWRWYIEWQRIIVLVWGQSPNDKFGPDHGAAQVVRAARLLTLVLSARKEGLQMAREGNKKKKKKTNSCPQNVRTLPQQEDLCRLWMAASACGWMSVAALADIRD